VRTGYGFGCGRVLSVCARECDVQVKLDLMQRNKGFLSFQCPCEQVNDSMCQSVFEKKGHAGSDRRWDLLRNTGTAKDVACMYLTCSSVSHPVSLVMCNFAGESRSPEADIGLLPVPWSAWPLRQRAQGI
jgi:hypothetical protein